MTTPHRKDGTFRRGNRAAAKGADDRKPVTMRLPEVTRAKLRAHATSERSQADIVIAAVAAWRP